MPNYSCYYDNVTSGGTGDWEESIDITHRVYEQELEQGVDLIQELWEEHQQTIDQQEKQAEELRKDKENYPLFFWKEKK